MSTRSPGGAAQKHKKPAAGGSCQPTGIRASTATQGERNGMRQRNTFGAEYLCLSEGGRRRPVKRRSARSGRPQRYQLPAESCGAAAVSPFTIMGRDRPATGSRRGTCGLSWPGRVDVTGTGDGRHGRESWFAVMLDLGARVHPGRDGTESAMKNSQRAGSQDDRAGTAWMRRWTGEKLSVRLFLVAYVLVLTGALVWVGWFASASQNATWSTVLIITAAVGGAASAKRRSRMSRSR